MSYSLAFTLIAAGIGIVAGLWLCVGSAFTSTETVAELATSYWDYHETHANVVVAQSVQYSVGAPLLVLAFAFQVLAAVPPPGNVEWLPPQLSSPVAFVLAVLFPVGGLSFVAYKLLIKVRGARVHALLQKRQAESERQARGDS